MTISEAATAPAGAVSTDDADPATDIHGAGRAGAGGGPTGVGAEGKTDAPIIVSDRIESLAWRAAGVLGVALVAVGAAFVVTYARSMASTSLWTDELFTTRWFTSGGPVNAVTNYKTANNHVFHSLITSLVPGPPRAALRARFGPIVLTTLSFALVGWHFARRRQLVVGALVLYPLLLDVAWLDLGMQSRGYGPLAFFAVVASLAVIRFFEHRRTRELVVLGVAVVLGTWTLPSFAFFAAPLFVVLFAVQRSRKVVVCAIASGLGSLAVYAPILSALVRATRSYAEEFGGDNFTSLGTVGSSFATYLFQPTAFGTWGWLAIAGMVVTAGAVLLTGTTDPEHRRSALVLGGAVAGFFAVCLVLRTPILRTTAFTMWPVVLGWGTLVGGATVRLPRRPGVGRLAIPAIAGAVIVVLLLNAVGQLRTFTFRPLENWEVSTDHVTAIVPIGTLVVATWSPEYVDDYLPSSYPVVGTPDPAAFADGRAVIVEQPRPKADEPDTGGAPVVVAVESPQRRFGNQRLLLGVPPDSRLAALTVAGTDRTDAVTDRRADTTVTSDPAADGGAVEVVVRLAGDVPSRSVVLATASVPASIQADAVHPDGSKRRLRADELVRSDDALVLTLADELVSEVVIRAPRRTGARPFTIREAWSYPVSR